MAKELRMNKLSLALLIALGIVVCVFVISKTKRGYKEETIRLSELISASIHLVELGGKRVVQVRNMGDSEIGQLSKGQTKEGKNEYVTMGDKESHQIIVSGLKLFWPNLPLQSEEQDMPLIDVKPYSVHNPEVKSVSKRDEEVLMDKVTVWVDPLDATQEYTEGKEDPSLLKFVTVMICVAVSGKPVAGIIHQPFLESGAGGGVTKWAWVNHGLSDSLVLSAVNAESDNLRVIYSRSHAGEVSNTADAAFKDTYNVQHIQAAGSGYKVLQVVEGKADLYLHTTRIKKWDICAGNALLNAVDGKMTTLKGDEIDYSFKGTPLNEDGIVATDSEEMQHDYLMKLEKTQ